MRKIIYTLLMMLLIIPIITSAQEQPDIAKMNEASLADTIRELNTRVEQSCEDAIISYRSELERVVKEQESILFTEFEKIYKKERILLFAGVLMAGFIGSTIAMSIQRVIFSKKDEQIRDGLEAILKEYKKFKGEEK